MFEEISEKSTGWDQLAHHGTCDHDLGRERAWDQKAEVRACTGRGHGGGNSCWWAVVADLLFPLSPSLLARDGHDGHGVGVHVGVGVNVPSSPFHNDRSFSKRDDDSNDSSGSCEHVVLSLH